MLILDGDDERWAQFVETCPGATPFHHPSWARLLADSYGHKRFALALVDGGRVISGVPINEVRTPLGRPQWVSLPLTDQCPPLAVNEESRAQLAIELDAVRREAAIPRIEVRGRLQGPATFPTSVAVIHKLRLTPDPDAVYRTFKSSHRRNVQQAERRGVTIRRADRVSDLTDVFYPLHLETRRRLGVPVQPKKFFARMWAQVIQPGLGFALLAFAGNLPLAGAVFMAWKDTVIYKYGASNPLFLALRPNNLIFWSVIRWACENGYRELDFGRTDLDNHGLRSFKKGWGSWEEPLVYTTIADKPRDHSSGRLSKAAAPLIRHSPSSVCRFIGELLYRYAT